MSSNLSSYLLCRQKNHYLMRINIICIKGQINKRRGGRIMISKSSVLRLLFFVLLCVLAGCASSGTTQLSQPLTTNLSVYKSIVVAVKSDVANTDALVVQIESAVISALRKQGKYSKVFSSATSNVAEAELRVTVDITRIRDVNPYDRVMWGALAGQGKIYADVELTESQSGRVLSKGSIVGKTSGGSVFAGTTPQAAERVADEVVKFISSQ